MSDNRKTSTANLGAQLKGAFQDTVDEGLPDHFRALIDQNLKKGVEETLQEGIPDRFRDLLAKLEDVSGDGGSK